MCLVFSLVGCGDKAGGGDSEENKTPDVTPGTMSEINPALVNAVDLSKSLDPDKKNVILFYYRPDGNYSSWGLWLWPTGAEADENDYTKTKNFTKDLGTGIAYINLSEADLSAQVKDVISEETELNFIIRTDNWAKDPDGDRKMDFSISKHFISISGDSTVYPVTESVAPSIKSASAFSTTELKVELSVKLGLETKPSSNGFSLVADDNSVINVSDVKNFKSQGDRYKNYTDTLYVKLESPIDVSKNWSIKHEKFSPENGCQILTHEIFKNSDFVYSGNDLGLTLNGNIATFKTWAPVASSVSLLLYESASELNTPSTDPKAMSKNSDGIWTIENVDISLYDYYKFRIVNNGDTNDVCDIYAKACSPDSVASQIVDIEKDTSTMPSSWKENYTNPWQGTDYSDAIIYEMHIRDWAKAIGGDGKFIELAESDDFINHLKDIGITHVQILPAFDYAQPNSDEKYNWGYNPYHYNVPEGRYVKDMVDGSDAVKQFRELILALHNANIAVIMDVVYNHTAGTGKGSLYDMTVPYYYYRLNKDGTYSNGVCNVNVTFTDDGNMNISLNVIK
jgi:pullulanase